MPFSVVEYYPKTLRTTAVEIRGKEEQESRFHGEKKG